MQLSLDFEENKVNDNDYTFIDLFAGIGGIRLGFERSGFKCIFSSEWDAFAARTYASNFGDIPFGDITKISNDKIPRHDILCGGFPCQPFSTIGKRQGFEHETQGNLFFEITRILNSKKPIAFLLENVVGIKNIDGGRTFKTIINMLEEIGYNITFLELDSSDYGVPQKRKRVYFIGFNKMFSKPFIYKKPELKTSYIGSFIEENMIGYALSDKILKYLFKKDDGRPQIIDKNSNFHVKTLVSTYHKIQRLTGTFVKDGENIRLLSENECKAIMGFPKDFKFPVSRTQMYRQLGNSVAVPVIEDISKQMMEWILSNEQIKKNLRRTEDESKKLSYSQ